MTQTQFNFDAPIVNSTVVDPAERRRLAGQHLAIYERLRGGPATNRELSVIALNYRGRIHELRKSGISITAERVRDTGLTVYSLTENLT